MSKFKIEIQITLLAITIGIVVVVIGYFSFKSLSEIVHSIHQETRPNNKLFLIKNIASDLTALENSVRLYDLTENKNDLQTIYTIEDRISKGLNELKLLKEVNEYDLALIDTISKLTDEKLQLWNKILKIYLSGNNFFSEFSNIYAELELGNPDSTLAGNKKNKTLQKDTADVNVVAADSSLKDQSIERKKIKRKLLSLEWEIYQKNKVKNKRESGLIEQNGFINEKLNQLIIEAERHEVDEFQDKTIEADRLAKITYKRLAEFVISAVFLLLIALFILFNYLRKTRAYQRALTEARKKAESLALAKEQFAANVSHELRTPVNAIYGLSEQVIQKKLDKNTAEMVSVIYKSARHLKNIINDTLDFTKLQAQKIVFESIHFSPFEVFGEVISIHKPEADKKGISLNFKWEGERSQVLLGDPLRLKQILINLIGNAVKFTEKGEVTVKVKGSKTGDQYFDLVINITDTGIGISDKNLPLIFDEYVQIDNQAGRKYSGTGLGLSIVKKMVELQGGKINVKSGLGKGTQVTLNIPFRIGDQASIIKTEDETFLIPEAFKQLLVLIADDEEYNRFLLKKIFQKWNVKFREANNGNEVINAAFKEKFDIILMDLNMPELNGLEATKVISKYNPWVKIVATTAAIDESDKLKCINAGMKGFLIKPFSEKDLFNIFNSVLPGEKAKINSNHSQPVSFDDIKRLANGDNKFLKEMILLFIKSMETGIANTEKAIMKKNWNSVFENVHKMAAPVKHMGATHLYGNIKSLEMMAQNNEVKETVLVDFQIIKKEVEELNTFLKSHLDEIDT